MSERIIGIRHRTKRTAEGEARPTLLALQDGSELRTLELATEEEELDFLLGRLPTGFRPVSEQDEIDKIPSHHQKWRPTKPGEDVSAVPERFIRKDGKRIERLTQIPSGYEGFASGDTVVSIFGGSGSTFLAALSRRAEELTANVLAIAPYELLKARGARSKDEDHETLVSLYAKNPELFHVVGPRDRDLIQIDALLALRTEAQGDRIACKQRLRQHAIGKVFLNPEGRFPEGSLKEIAEEELANNLILKNLQAEEERWERELRKAVHDHPTWPAVFENVEGVGEVLAAKIITSIVDVRRFPTVAKFKKFCGVHVTKDGTFPRNRRWIDTKEHPIGVEEQSIDTKERWNRNARQAFVLVGEQFNYRPDSEWGKKLLVYKAALRQRHPEVVEVDGKKRYTDAHIHKMALWRARTRFAEWLYGALQRAAQSDVERVAA